MPRKIVITGAEGLVGHAVVQYALDNTDYHLVLVDVRPPASTENALDPSRIEYHTTSLIDFDHWKEFMTGVDALIHLAAYAQPYRASPTEVHNMNTSVSWNALRAAVDAGVKRVVMAGSINAIGGAYSAEAPRYQYFPLDEEHPSLAEDAYSVSKLIGEIQADAIARANRDMSIATLRFHWVHAGPRHILDIDGYKKDLWSWVSPESTARACLLGLEMKPKGHHVMFIAGPHCIPNTTARELAEKYYPDTEIRPLLDETQVFYSCAKAERVLGWKHEGGAQPQGF